MSDFKQYRIQLILDGIDKYTHALRTGKLIVDPNGHYKYRDENFLNYIEGILLSRIFFGSLLLQEEDIETFSKIINILDSPTEEFYLFPVYNHQCYKCGNIIAWETNGKIIRAVSVEFEKNKSNIIRNKCIYAYNVPDIILELDVPSGKLVFDNDLRRFFPENVVFENGRWCDKYDLNIYQGEMNYSKKYADVGLIHCFVGNTSPNVYQLNSEILFIGHDDNEKIFNAEYVGKIYTDLWWFSCADYNLLKSINEELLNDILSKSNYGSAFVVDVSAGKYRITHSHQSNYFNDIYDSCDTVIRKII